jgi:hypothetical protein
MMIVARIERLEAADIRDTDTRSRRLAPHAEAVRVPFQAKRTTASDEKQKSGSSWARRSVGSASAPEEERLPLCSSASTALVPDAPSYLSRSSTALDA